MVMDKAIIFLLAGVLVGAGVGIGVGYFVFSDSGDSDQTYYFYIDYGPEASSENVNGWISAKGADQQSAMEKALSNNNIPYELNSWGYLDTISGVGDASMVFWWMNWVWEQGEADTAYYAWVQSSGWDSVGTIFYYVFSEPTASFAPGIDPNFDTSVWKTAAGSPFA